MRVATWLSFGAAAVVVAATLVSVGQPVFAEDTWWHLAMGRAYAAAGPWLDADPLLFTAQEIPAPASWLAGVLLHGLEAATGFQGLRVFHTALVATILWMAARALLRTSGSIAFASLATAVFAALSAYRLFQLRPELLTVSFALLLVQRLVLDGSTGTSSAGRKPMGAAIFAAVLFGCWANVHAAFLLGPILLATATGAAALAAWIPQNGFTASTARLRMFASALVVGTLATFVNPEGAGPHLLYFIAGSDTPSLASVVDEWSRFPLLTLPKANLPPSLLSWGATWLAMIGLPISLLFAARARRRERSRGSQAQPLLDPVLLAIAAASLVAMLLAVRFSWMVIFVLLALGHTLRVAGAFEGRGRAASGMCAVLAVATAWAFFSLGAWPMISRAVNARTYAAPYPAAKHQAHAIWFLADSGVEGRIFNDYSSGNFLGYWLGPKVMTFINGSMNIPRATRDDGVAIERRGWQSEIPIETLLDRHEIDLFFGSGMPFQRRANRETPIMTRHLERTEGWMLVFRTITAAVYLRTNDRNRVNLDRIADYYAAAGVPFDRRTGFDPLSIIEHAPRWATDHGIIPRDWPQVLQNEDAADPSEQLRARHRQATTLVLLGAYEQAAELDRETLGRNPRAQAVAKRLLFCLLQIGESAQEEASILAQALEEVVGQGDPVATLLISAARNGPTFEPAQRRAMVSTVPMLTRAEAKRFGIGFVGPEARR